MAETEEEVIVIEDDEENEEQKPKKKESFLKKNKLFLIILGIVFLILLLLIILIIVLIKKKKEQKPVNNEVELLAKKLKQTPKVLNSSILKDLVQKANILYQKGNKEEALKILRKISIYSEAISNYNLGVIKLKEKKYKKAIEYFKKAINAKDHRALSALNIAVASLHLNDKVNFRYYINLAYLYLPEESNSKNYLYYYALINYYKGSEYEALPALIHYHNKDFFKQKELLKADILNMYKQNTLSLDALSNVNNNKFALALMYAREGEYSLAKELLDEYKKLEITPKVLIASSLVDLRLSYFKQASDDIKQSMNINYKVSQSIYPIEVFLNKQIFDINFIQNIFKKEFFSEDMFYKMLFYYAPYKIFDASRVLRKIKKGNYALTNDIQESQSFLNRSSTIANVNLQISLALEAILDDHIYKANQILNNIIKKEKYYDLVYYDLALTYAQIGNFKEANKYFIKAYNLNPQNYLAGIFSAISAILSNQEPSSKRLEFMKDDLADLIDKDDKYKFYYAIINYIQNNNPAALEFVQNDGYDDSFHLIFDIMLLHRLEQDYTRKAYSLKTLLPKDIVANLFYFYTINQNLPIKDLARKFQTDIDIFKLDRNKFYYGFEVASEFYLTFAKISGLLPKIRNELENKILLEKDDINSLLLNLGYTNLYTKHFEESYTIFNDLILNKRFDNSKVLFLGAVSAIGAGHNANAIALLELAKLKNPLNLESRYALGILYQEAHNLNAASIQYSKIRDGFVSRYFDFNLKDN